MVIDRQLLELMPRTVTIRPKSSRDSYGQPVYGTAETYRCRVETSNHLVRSSSGEEVVARGRVILAGPCPDVTSESDLVLHDGATVKVLSVEQHDDEDGAHHTVVHYG